MVLCYVCPKCKCVMKYPSMNKGKCADCGFYVQRTEYLQDIKDDEIKNNE